MLVRVGLMCISLLCLVTVKRFSENTYFSEMLIFRKGKYFYVFGFISKNFPENIFWCLEKKKENTNLEKHKPQPRKKSCHLACARSRRRDRDQRRDLAPARSRSTSRSRDGAISLSLSLFFRKSFEVKMEVVIDFRGQRPFFWVNGFQFPKNRIFRTNQTASFPEKHFRK